MPQRSPLIDLPINRVSGYELSNATRSEIHARACAGESYGAIARSKSLPRSTVSTTVKTVNTRRSVESKARIGRPPVHSDRDRRRILQHVRQHPMCTYDNLKRETGLDFSRSTYRRILHATGVLHWLAKKRPALTPHQAQVRLAFASLHRHKDWSNTLFSDECPVEKGVGKKRLWAFGDPSQKWDVDKIQHIRRVRVLQSWFGHVSGLRSAVPTSLSWKEMRRRRGGVRISPTSTQPRHHPPQRDDVFARCPAPT